jgi:hypothetical protein
MAELHHAMICANLGQESFLHCTFSLDFAVQEAIHITEFAYMYHCERYLTPTPPHATEVALNRGLLPLP